MQHEPKEVFKLTLQLTLRDIRQPDGTAQSKAAARGGNTNTLYGAIFGAVLRALDPARYVARGKPRALLDHVVSLAIPLEALYKAVLPL